MIVVEGKIVVVLSIERYSSVVVAARFTEGGQVDTTFGSTGVLENIDERFHRCL